jgi:hypothetical protein
MMRGGVRGGYVQWPYGGGGRQWLQPTAKAFKRHWLCVKLSW